jgi:transcriptional regulator with XRE-family HTH domain
MAALDRIKFGKVVRRLRVAKGWTQEELADHANLHPTYVGGIERGERNVGLENIIKIARALGVSAAALFGGGAK